jgi:CBS domain-containing protein
MSGGAVKLLINAGASILPVVNDKGDVVGVLSEYDIIQHMLEGEGAFDLQAHLETHGALPEVYVRALAGPVSGVMSKPAISATEDTRLKVIADLMVKHRIHNIPVVRDAKVEGIVNRVALGKALLSRPDSGSATAPPADPAEVDDEQLRRDVVVAIRRLGLPLGGGFDVVARHGAVHHWGQCLQRGRSSQLLRFGGEGARREGRPQPHAGAADPRPRLVPLAGAESDQMKRCTEAKRRFDCCSIRRMIIVCRYKSGVEATCHIDEDVGAHS